MPANFLERWREVINELPAQGAIDELSAQFRTLRLWHWNMARYHRNTANLSTFGPARDLQNTQADFHIKQVQLLNVFFAVGDTAEADAAK